MVSVVKRVCGVLCLYVCYQEDGVVHFVANVLVFLRKIMRSILLIMCLFYSGRLCGVFC